MIADIYRIDIWVKPKKTLTASTHWLCSQGNEEKCTHRRMIKRRDYLCVSIWISPRETLSHSRVPLVSFDRSSSSIFSVSKTTHFQFFISFAVVFIVRRQQESNSFIFSTRTHCCGINRRVQMKIVELSILPRNYFRINHFLDFVSIKRLLFFVWVYLPHRRSVSKCVFVVFYIPRHCSLNGEISVMYWSIR